MFSDSFDTNAVIPPSAILFSGRLYADPDPITTINRITRIMCALSLQHELNHSCFLLHTHDKSIINPHMFPLRWTSCLQVNHCGDGSVDGPVCVHYRYRTNWTILASFFMPITEAILISEIVFTSTLQLRFFRNYLEF